LKRLDRNFNAASRCFRDIPDKSQFIKKEPPHRVALSKSKTKITA